MSRIMFIELGDWPGGQLSCFECRYPGAPDGGIDLVLPVHCSGHGRNWYWCPNAAVVWCDGGPDSGWQVHLLGEPAFDADDDEMVGDVA